MRKIKRVMIVHAGQAQKNPMPTAHEVRDKVGVPGGVGHGKVGVPGEVGLVKVEVPGVVFHVLANLAALYWVLSQMARIGRREHNGLAEA